MQSPSASPALSNEEGAGSSQLGAEDVGEDNYIEKSALLDIAFLHSIASHRPIGPHKHFNVIPILINLDRTARQVGARIRDDSYLMSAVKGGGDGGGDDEGEGSERRSIKREDETDNEEAAIEQGSSSSTTLPVDSTMIWHRLNQLYDVDGLEDLENQAIENDADSPFRNSNWFRRRRPGLSKGFDSPFGYGSGLEKKKKPVKSGRPSVSSKKGATAEDDDERSHKDGEVEFELGPWEDYEDLIAPRRLKSYAPDEEGPSESDEDLSEPSEIEAQGEDEAEAEENDGEGASEEEPGEEEEDEEEVDDDESEEEEDSTSKRKASTKRGSTASSKKSKQAAQSSRGTRNSTKPRRSTRR